jgi:arylsulfatase A
MTRRSQLRLRVSLKAIVFLLMSGSTMSAAQTGKAPNIVLLVADDLGWGDVGFNGRTEWATPNLDRLAKEGRRLERCYTAAVVCAPSRAAFLTGKSTIHSGVRANTDDLPGTEVTIAEAVRPLGYRTALFGKWHSGKPRPGATGPVHPIDQGFDEFFGYVDAEHAWRNSRRSSGLAVSKSRSPGTSTT